MTYWHDSADDQKDIWHWITVAVALAQTIGLNQDPDTLEDEHGEAPPKASVVVSVHARQAGGISHATSGEDTNARSSCASAHSGRL